MIFISVSTCCGSRSGQFFVSTKWTYYCYYYYYYCYCYC